METHRSFTSRLKEKDGQFFGHTKDGQVPPSSLLVRHRDHNQEAFSYQYLTKQMRYNPSEGITLAFCDPNGTVQITIEGRNLDALWDHLHRHTVTFIQPAPTMPDQTPEDELCITEIRVEEV